MAPPVPAEDEFVEIGLDMSLAEPVIDAEAEALQVREDAVNPRQEHMRRHRPDDFGHVMALVHARIGGETIGEDCRAKSRVGGDEIFQSLPAIVGNQRQPDAAGLAAFDALDRPDNEDFPVVIAALATRDRIVFRPEGDAGLVDLDYPRQWVAVRIDHGFAQFVQEQPGRLVGADPELALELQGRNTVGMRRDQMRGDEPSAQGQVCSVHDRAGGHRGLLAACTALESPGLRRQLPALPRVAARTDEAIGPAPPLEPVGANVVVSKIRHELLEGGWPIVLPAADLGVCCHFVLIDERSPRVQSPEQRG